MNEMFGGDSPFSDFFQTFFGGAAPGGDARTRGRAGRGQRGARAGRDVEHELDLTLDEAFHGAMRRLSLAFDGEARSVDVRIPAGISDGARVRVAGEGERGSGGGKSGDLYLRIHVTPHAQFERKGRDLYTRVSVPLTTAILGGEVDVKTLAGKSLRLKVPPLTQPGQVFRLKGHGMPVTGKPDEHGELYATADLQLPKTLTPEQREHFEALQKLEKA
jgi:DnaJ-class molecular chaperone